MGSGRTDYRSEPGEPTISVGVGGLPAHTGHERPVCLEDEGTRTDFVLADIAVDEHELRCLRDRSEQASAFREGFTLTLEPGMGAMLAP
jgi:hypothetical protein